MSSKQAQNPSQYTTISRPQQDQSPHIFTHHESKGSDRLNAWLSSPASAAPFHNISAYRSSASASGSGANVWGSGPAPSSNGATWGSGHGRQS
ncbi:hypothetical protein CORC01_12140 [Colletotrichum orchidophilum]|uniref:Uncharacterized protein n=1 Tax=Colletotrichum orchidophilum TaxID=1209926 RepID=A0A1G4ATX7_9PEZI|nr:uncharacterized protein CORC01_12140 [Colletotrichum orchidophilum]OHE92561.1 hypothetical protein CORC01_12140 [Colletotrichum orchidophilum]